MGVPELANQRLFFGLEWDRKYKNWNKKLKRLKGEL